MPKDILQPIGQRHHPLLSTSAQAKEIVGIGLLCAPMEQAQAAVPKVTEVIVKDWDLLESFWLDMEVVHSWGIGSGVWSSIRVLLVWDFPAFARMD